MKIFLQESEFTKRWSKKIMQKSLTVSLGQQFFLSYSYDFYKKIGFQISQLFLSIFDITIVKT